MTMQPRKEFTRTTRLARLRGGDKRHEIERVRAYMPRNYEVRAHDDGSLIIVGHDDAGWTLDGYVLPRLATGLLFADEISAEDLAAIADPADPAWLDMTGAQIIEHEFGKPCAECGRLNHQLDEASLCFDCRGDF